MLFRALFTFIVIFYNFNKINTNNIALYDKYNVALVDETGFKIDMQFNDSDYEMITENEIKNSHIKYPDERFREFHKIAKTEYEKSKFHHELNMKLIQAKANTYQQKSDNLLKVTSSTIQVSDYSIQKRSVNDDDDYEENNETPESIENVTKEEMSEPVTEENFIKIELKEEILKFESLLVKLKGLMKEIYALNANYNCTDDELKGIGIKAIKCTLKQFGQKQKSFRFLIENLLEIIMIWLFVYFIFALPLWCTKGWCSCCLCCKFFKPQQTIKEAKKYLLLNPPGTLVTKKGGIIHYEPTERERDCYEEFGHFMRTL